MLGKHSYLKLIQTSFSLPNDTRRPRQRGTVMSIETLARMKFPPYVSFGLAKGITLPWTTQIFSTTFTFINLIWRYEIASKKSSYQISALQWKDFCLTFLWPLSICQSSMVHFGSLCQPLPYCQTQTTLYGFPYYAPQICF